MIVIVVILYIIGAILTFGMQMAEWYTFYKKQILRDKEYPYYKKYVIITSDIIMYTLFPFGLIVAIILYLLNKDREYLFKWSFKSLRDL